MEKVSNPAVVFVVGLGLAQFIVVMRKLQVIPA